MDSHQVVVIGAGFGGLECTRALSSAGVHVTVIDRRNHHLFQPLLYQVATTSLATSEIAWPVRHLLRKRKDVTTLLGTVTGLDMAGKRVLLEDGGSVPYDTLVLATGARHAYFGHDEWEAVAPGLKKIDDATQIRRRILSAFEQAEAGGDAKARRRLLTFVVIGGGPTGVEMSGAIAELARVALRHDFRNIDPREARIVLVEAGPRVLAAFPETLSAAAQRALERLGVEVRLGTPVTQCDADGVTIGEDRLPAETIVWAAGVAASPASRWLSADHDRAGRVMVGADLTLPGYPEIFCIGDTALAKDASGKPLPGLAPVAKQQGAYVARVLRARLAGKPEPGPFRYRDFGTLATIGRGAAVADFGWLRLSGTLAWLLWGAVHISFLIGFRNRLVVLIDWLWAYLTFQSGARLITGPGSH